MGKGRIISEQGDGLYTIEILEDRTRAQVARDLAVARVADLDERITTKESERAQAQVEVDAAADALDQAIAARLSELEAEGASDIDTTQEATALQEAAAKRDAITGHLRALKVERLALQRRIDLIDALPPLRQRQAWCADYTEALAGEVATAEVPGEVGQVLIQPGYDGAEVAGWPAGVQGGAAWSATTDGAIQPALAGTPAGVFYNLAMLPGWQKWRPTFRIGTISNLAADLCDITLDPATSSQQGLDVNAQASYTGVPIYYMECNGGVFEVGDRVLVAFSGNTSAPMVVGFETRPRLCSGEGLLDLQTALDQVYGLAAQSPIELTQPNPRNERTTSLGATYDCGGTTYTEVFYDHQTVSATEVIDYRAEEPFLYLEVSDGLAAINGTAGTFALSERATSLTLQVAAGYGITRNVTFTTTGSGGIDGGGTWDGTCKPGYTTVRDYVVDTQHDLTVSGEIEVLGYAVTWQRALAEVLDYDDGGTTVTAFIDDATWPIYNNAAATYTGSDVITIGAATADLAAVSAHYGRPWYALQSLFLISLIPEVHVSVSPAGVFCAVSVCEVDLFDITHYIVAFELVDGTWTRADVPAAMAGHIASNSTRRDALEAAKGTSYDQAFVSVPVAVG